jgi:CBS domain-containing protein/anti-sigma regulatory factor (Ser/Thr protein kinase)
MTSSTSPIGVEITDQIAENITRVEELAYELKISEVMTHNPKVATPDMKMKDVVELFRSAQISGVPIVRDEKLVGIMSMEDLIRCLNKADIEAKCDKYMTAVPITVNSFDLVIEALKVFVSSKVGRLPVVDENGRLVGIITKGDVTRGLLKVLQRHYEAEEMRRYRASHLFEDIESDRTSLILRYTIKPDDFIHGGSASSHIKRALLRLGASPQIARRCSIAIYEAEMNLIIHATNGGTLRIDIEPHQITMDAVDDGPGIKDVQLALKPGYSTANESIRELGFGAGMGLVNISRCVDSMKLESVVAKGTRLRMKILLEKKDAFRETNPNLMEPNRNEPQPGNTGS